MAQLLDVGAGAEGAVAGAGDHQHPGIARRRLVERLAELADNRKGKRVESLGAVQRDQRRLLHAGQLDGHWAASLAGSKRTGSGRIVPRLAISTSSRLRILPLAVRGNASTRMKYSGMS